jgi:CRP-like cAMP-binding protein
LKSIKLFEGLESYNLLKLIDGLETVLKKAGEVIIQEGDLGKELYIIESGIAVCQKGGKDLKTLT